MICHHLAHRAVAAIAIVIDNINLLESLCGTQDPLETTLPSRSILADAPGRLGAVVILLRLTILCLG